jgi:hypothetical protein
MSPEDGDERVFGNAGSEDGNVFKCGPGKMKRETMLINK